MKRMSWIEKQAAEHWANVDAATKARYEPAELRENFDEEMKAFIDSGRKAEYDGKAVKEAIQDRKYWRIFENISVKALKRSTSSLATCKKIFDYYNQGNLFSQIMWCDGDINDIPSLEEHMKDCNKIIHAAALVSFQKSDLSKLKKINIEGTANVMNLAL